MKRRGGALLFALLLAPDAGAQQGDAALWRLFDEKGATHQPATAHRSAAGTPLHINALIRERSPYLLSYAHSPVDWLPWGEPALANARERERLVFVSIGYSSCHWCHVMARESFDDLGIAAVLNGGYVSLKIDSEERPDLDRRFLARLEALGISPGWPMNFVLTPDNEVIWGATYIGRDELLSTLERLESRWRTDRTRLRRLAAAREGEARARGATGPAPASVAEAYDRQGRSLAGEFDPVHKGFGTGRKFPAPAELGFLHDAFVRGKGDEYAGMFVDTVRAIASGALFDPIDGGVFRYSVTRDWTQPHFEKMLYDQAQVSRLLCQAHALTGDPALRHAAAGIVDFTFSRLSTPSGLFASSLDAESEGVEGGYYLWSPGDLERLSPRIRGLVSAHFRRLPQSAGLDLLVPALPRDADAVEEALPALRAIRESRRAPRRDDKAITAWNANMVSALAECGATLGIPRYAARAATRMRRLLETNAPGGRVHRYSVAGEATGPASIEDLGWLLAALVSLDDADGAEEWLGHARRVVDRLAAIGDETLQRELEVFAGDRIGISPSAVLVQALARLARRSDDAAFASELKRVSTALRNVAGGRGDASVTAALRDLESPLPRRVAHAAQGIVRLEATPPSPQGEAVRFAILAGIRPGWHINSDKPVQDYLRPTRIEVRGADGYEVTYPAGKPMRFGPTGDVLSVLEGMVRFEVRIPAAPPGKPFPLARLAVTVQPCTHEVCLRPETLELWVPLPPGPTRAAPRL